MMSFKVVLSVCAFFTFTQSVFSSSYFNMNRQWIREENRKTNNYVREGQGPDDIFYTILKEKKPSVYMPYEVRSNSGHKVIFEPVKDLKLGELKFFEPGTYKLKEVVLLGEIYKNGLPTTRVRSAFVNKAESHVVIAFARRGNVSTLELVEYSFKDKTFKVVESEASYLDFNANSSANEYAFYTSDLRGGGKYVVRVFGENKPKSSQDNKSMTGGAGDKWQRIKMSVPLGRDYYFKRGKDYPKGAILRLNRFLSEDKETVEEVLDVAYVVKGDEFADGCRSFVEGQIVCLKHWAGKTWLDFIDFDGKPFRQPLRLPKTMNARFSWSHEGPEISLMVYSTNHSYQEVTIDLEKEIVQSKAAPSPWSLSFYDFENLVMKLDELPLTINYLDATSHDGEDVPYVALELGRYDLAKPTLVKVYGGFNVNMLGRVFLDEHEKRFIKDGGRVVIADLRGGSSKGPQWFFGGRKEKRINTAYDLIAVSQDLQKRGMAAVEQIVTTGTSNGGYVVSLAATIDPSAFRGVIPVNGVLNFSMKDVWDSRYFGWSYDYLSSYSHDDPMLIQALNPVELGKERILENKKMPKFLVISALADVRVSPLHSYSFVEELRGFAEKVGREDLTSSMFFYGVKNMGHGINGQVDIGRGFNARIWSFIYKETGMKLGSE